MSQCYIDYIKSIDIGTAESAEVWLSPQLKSTKFMTRLKHRGNSDCIDDFCKNPIDVLYVTIFEKKYYLFKTLVVLYIPRKNIQDLRDDWNLSRRRTTFTHFKQMRKSHWFCMCNDEPFDAIDLTNGKTLKLWKNPYVLEAVTEYDKDFRKEWRNGDLEYEGNEYGDTSEFFIIGCLDK